jgi:PAS domain S-box-containing protein
MESSSAQFVERLRLRIDSRTSYAYLHALIEYNPIAVIVLDSKHKFQMCNPAFERLFQFDSAELETWGIDGLIAGPDFIHEAGQMTRRVLSGERVHILTKRRRKDGLLIDVEMYGVPLLLDGRVAGVYGLYQDVTERMQLAAAAQQMTARLNTAREEERRRFARDLHDSLSQELALLNWNLRRLEQSLPVKDTATAEVLNQTRELADLCINQIRSASFLLHPPQLGEAELNTAIAWLAEGFQKRSGIAVEVILDEPKEQLPMPMQSALYRVVQEALANVLRHARDSSIEVRLIQNADWLELSVTNHRATAAPVSTFTTVQGVGLAGMHERLKELSGTLQVHSSVWGLRIVASVPLCEGVACAL